MSMIGREYPSEISRFQDSKTGREIVRLTGQAHNHHLYFTDNAFTLGDEEIYFSSSRSNMDTGYRNLFRMDLKTGIMTQMTDEIHGIGSVTKTSDSELAVYLVDGMSLKKLNTKTGESMEIYRETDPNYRIGCPFISPDKKTVGIVRGERSSIGVGKNYVGFAETMYSIKKSYITLVDIDGKWAKDVFLDTHWVGHFQFAPDDGNIAMFCHEGPWNLVQQRIWILDMEKGDVTPCYRQEADDSIGHESWTRDGLIFFDNRRAGHDGTITVSKKQAVVLESQIRPGQIPFVGLADRHGNLIKKIDMPYYCNHYHANADNSLLVGDAVEDLVLIDLTRETPALETLCYHGTSWNGGDTHCHPTFGWNGKKILYTSDKRGECDIYLTEI